MKQVLVRYKVKAGRGAENEAFVRGVFEQLAQRAPKDIRYSSLRLEDGVTFVHVLESEVGSMPLSDLPAFKAFTADVRERCDEPPIATEFTRVGAYPA
jgi:hypothetical protein